MVNTNQTSTPILKAEDLSFKILPKMDGYFTLEFTTYLKDSNAYGNIYFSRHFEWQGIMREAFFTQKVTKNMLGMGIKMVTRDAACKYINESFPFQDIIGRLSVPKIHPTSVQLRFEFFEKSSGKLISDGHQRIVETDIETTQIKIPDSILTSLEVYKN